MFVPINEANVQKAETDFKDFVEAYNIKYKHNNDRELLIMTKEMEGLIGKQFEKIAIEYKNNTANRVLTKYENKRNAIKYDNAMELQKKTMERETLKLKYAYEMSNLDREITFLNNEKEMLKSKLEEAQKNQTC
jgi:hypothetical protein